MPKMFDKAVKITRGAAAFGRSKEIGFTGVKGRTTATDRTIVKLVACSIQETGQGGSGANEGLPSDTRKGEWTIYIPSGKVRVGVIQKGDHALEVDPKSCKPTGRRFEIVNDESNFMGWRLRCDRLRV